MFLTVIGSISDGIEDVVSALGCMSTPTYNQDRTTLFGGGTGYVTNSITMGSLEIGSIQPQYLDRGRHKLDFLPVSSGYKQSN